MKKIENWLERHRPFEGGVVYALTWELLKARACIEPLPNGEGLGEAIREMVSGAYLVASEFKDQVENKP